MMLKRFDPEMHHKVDEPARDATKSYISKHGHTAMDHDDKYSVDLIVPGVCYIECECKLVWMTDTFEYKTIHIPKRKKKFAAYSSYGTNNLLEPLGCILGTCRINS